MKEALLDSKNTISMALSLIRHIIRHPSYEVLETPLIQPDNSISLTKLKHPIT